MATARLGGGVGQRRFHSVENQPEEKVAHGKSFALGLERLERARRAGARRLQRTDPVTQDDLTIAGDDPRSGVPGSPGTPLEREPAAGHIPRYFGPPASLGTLQVMIS